MLPLSFYDSFRFDYHNTRIILFIHIVRVQISFFYSLFQKRKMSVGYWLTGAEELYSENHSFFTFIMACVRFVSHAGDVRDSKFDIQKRRDPQKDTRLRGWSLSVNPFWKTRLFE